MGPSSAIPTMTPPPGALDPHPRVLALIAAREQADAERAARDTEEAARADELARWADQDQTDDRAADDVDDLDELDDGEPALSTTRRSASR